MQSWRSILQSNLFFLFLFFLTIIITLHAYCIQNESKYSLDTTEIIGTITEVSMEEGKFTIKGKEKVIVYYDFKEEEKKEEWIGSLVRVSGKFVEPKENTIPNTFNYKEYLYYKHIYYLCYANSIEKLKEPNILYSLKNNVNEWIEQNPNHTYLKAILLGSTEGLDTTDMEKNGVSHLFAVSGMHFALFISMVSFLFKKSRVGNIVLFVLLWFYAFLVGFTPSVLRVVVFYYAKKINHYAKDLWSDKQLFLFLFLCFVLINPFYLKDVGFEFSFLLSACFLYFERTKTLKSILKQNCMIFLASIPICAIHFYEVNAFSILLNLIFIPFMSFLYPMCLLSLFIPWMSGILSFYLNLFMWLNHLASFCNFLIIVIPKVSIFFWLVYLVFLYFFFERKKKKFLVLLLVLLCIVKMMPKWDSNAYVYFIDVGQGDASLIVSPFQKEVLLLDTGGSIYDREHYTGSNIKTFIYSLGIDKINHLVLSHGDYDHMGNAIGFLKEMKIQHVILNPNEYTDGEEEIVRSYPKKLQKSLQSKYIGIEEFTKVNKEENASSLIYRFTLYGTSFLFLGDAPKEIEDALPNIQSDVVKIAHHGSNTSSSFSFLKRVHPKYAIISVGKNNSYGHPSEETLDTLNTLQIPYYETKDQGTIWFQISKKGEKLQVMTS